MTLTGFGNLAVKVPDLDAALAFYEGAGARIGERGPWHGGERADLFLGPVQVTLFTRAIYEDAVGAARRVLPARRRVHRRPRRRFVGRATSCGARPRSRGHSVGAESPSSTLPAGFGSSSCSSSTSLLLRGRTGTAGGQCRRSGSTVKVTRILHHSVNVEGDLDECVEFYRRLSLTDTPRPAIPGVAGHWFAVEQAQVHLVDAPAGRRRHPARPGPTSASASRTSDAAVAELEDAGIPFVRGWQGEVEQIWVADPVGNTIELQQDPELAPVEAR